ncbi:hypothetical protein JOC85_001860 [Bacillus mesophilus]|uniref:Uncharacterized protein n=1 Tax=Bacillus mesophilus TaxID=1808955 RepID=A0A6M0Q6L0_9BACI|nr:hypothetical protein [Bacillus mesophilus]MBM7661088.1 hypothetical protein [Bacillus mesophilus]NEY71379.1 hypothetical protein [Bacillus mesophilus]
MLIVFISFISLVSFVVWSSFPKEINQEIDGFVYGVGEKRNEINERVRITIKGGFYNNIFNQDRFKGTIDIKGDVPTDILIDKENVEVVFLERNGTLFFSDYSKPADHNIYGNLYINKDLSKLSITIYELVESKRSNPYHEWGPEDGLLISAPATNRKEALSISNELIGHLLKPLE